MSRDNVKRVLVTSGNQAPLAAGNDLGSLADGQVGVFDADTHVAIDASKTPKGFYLAVGANGDHKESAGQYIQTNQLRGYTFRPHTPGRAQVLRLENFTPSNDVDDYAFKLEFRNSKIARLQGTNQFSQTYAVYNKDYTQEQFIDEAVATVNANELGFVEAAKLVVTTRAFTVAGDSTSKEYAEGDVVDVAGDETIVRGDGGFKTELQLTTKPVTANKALNLNLNYYDLRSTTVVASLVEGFDVNAKFTETQELRYEEGDGNQIRQAEYHETGKADPYVLSDVTGTARALNYNADGSVKYDRLVLEYGHFTEAGWLEALNDLQTDVAIPMADTATRDGLIAILDAQFTKAGFDALADDAAAASTDATVVEDTEDETADTDGIG
jgi:hypothetical protein